MGIFLTLLFISALMIVLPIYYLKNNEKVNISNGILFSSGNVRYMNGFKEISGDKKCSVILKKNKLIIDMPLNKIRKEFLIDNIIDAECMTEDQIQKEITIGRLLVFGALALGMQKKTNVVRKFAIIKIQNIESQIDLILEMYPDRLVQTILKLKNDKLEQVRN